MDKNKGWRITFTDVYSYYFLLSIYYSVLWDIISLKQNRCNDENKVVLTKTPNGLDVPQKFKHSTIWLLAILFLIDSAMISLLQPDNK